MKTLTAYLKVMLVVFGTLWLSNAVAQCASPVAAGREKDKSQWADVRAFRTVKSINPVISTVQYFNVNGVGDLNHDFYAVTIDARQDTPESLAYFVRQNFGRLVMSSTDGFYGHGDLNKLRWLSPLALGAVMTFKLTSFTFPPGNPGILPAGIRPITASVVVGCDAASNWIFSTVETAADSWHPVSGNRALGVSRTSDGGLQIWSKGLDRTTQEGAVGVFHGVGGETAREITFVEGDKLWKRFLDNFQAEFKDRSPRNRIVVSKRFPYPE